MAEQEAIGVAWLDEDGTISLRLRAVGPGVIGETLLQYRPNHAEYEEILTHLGGLKPGETKRVPPWPDQESSGEQADVGFPPLPGEDNH